MITQVLNRLKLWQKLGWLVLAMAIPAALVGFFYLRLANTQVSQAREELDGARYLQALSTVEGEQLTHRSRSFVFLSGDAPRKHDVISQQESVDKEIGQMDALDAEIGKRLGVSDTWQAVKAEWDGLKAKTLAASAADNETAEAALTNHFQQLADVVGARSKTSLDPEPNTQALIHLASDYTTRALIYANDMRHFAVKAAAKGYLGGDDRMGIQIYKDRYHAQMEQARAALERVSSDAGMDLRSEFDAATSAFTGYDSVVQTKLVTASNLTISGAEIYDAGVATNRALKKFSTVAYAATVKTLERRVSDLSVHRNIMAGISFLVLGFAIALSWLVSRSLTQPLNQAVSVFGKISSGQYDNQIETSATDEAGQVLRALDEMQTKLRTQIENERAVAAENTRIRQALDKASTSVVLADEKHQII
jgi:nitrogen fixation/metabolism regulation signal transduction histidine kinase